MGASERWSAWPPLSRPREARDSLRRRRPVLVPRERHQARRRRPLPREAAAFRSIGLVRADRSVAWIGAISPSLLPCRFYVKKLMGRASPRPVYCLHLRLSLKGG